MTTEENIRHILDTTRTAAVVDEAIAIGVPAVGLQLGVVNDDACAKARAAGLRAVQNRCTKIEIARRS